MNEKFDVTTLYPRLEFSVQDFFENAFCSYLWDMESNLEMDEETWADYQEDERPYVLDLIGDFGGFGMKKVDAIVGRYTKPGQPEPGVPSLWDCFDARNFAMLWAICAHYNNWEPWKGMEDGDAIIIADVKARHQAHLAEDPNYLRHRIH